MRPAERVSLAPFLRSDDRWHPSCIAIVAGLCGPAYDYEHICIDLGPRLVTAVTVHVCASLRLCVSHHGRSSQPHLVSSYCASHGAKTKDFCFARGMSRRNEVRFELCVSWKLVYVEGAVWKCASPELPISGGIRISTVLRHKQKPSHHNTIQVVPK